MSAVYWLEQSDADVPAENEWLSAGEAVRLNGMRFARRRADWRLGRWTAKRAVAAYLNLPGDPLALADIEIRPAASGAPEVFVANLASGVVISLSHRAGVAACALAPPCVALGCDLEVIEPRSDGFVADYFTPEEQALVALAPAEARPMLVTLLWSAKESALKALRVGLRLDTRSVMVSLPGLSDGLHGWVPLHVRHTGGESFRGWWQNTGSLVRTLVATPPPDPPTRTEYWNK